MLLLTSTCPQGNARHHDKCRSISLDNSSELCETDPSRAEGIINDGSAPQIDRCAFQFVDTSAMMFVIGISRNNEQSTRISNNIHIIKGDDSKADEICCMEKCYSTIPHYLHLELRMTLSYIVSPFHIIVMLVGYAIVIV